MDDDKLLKEAEAFATRILTEEFPEDFVYHNLAHTEEVVNIAKKIGADAGLDKHEMTALLLAAWFHDLGYARDARRHEEESIQMASQFLHERRAHPDLIELTLSAIEATRFSVKPCNRIECIIKDADMHHLSSENYPERGKKLRQEWENLFNRYLTDEEWREINTDFFNRHQYYSRYGKEKFEPRKQEIIKKWRKGD